MATTMQPSDQLQEWGRQHLALCRLALAEIELHNARYFMQNGPQEMIEVTELWADRERRTIAALSKLIGEEDG